MPNSTEDLDGSDPAEDLHGSGSDEAQPGELELTRRTFLTSAGAAGASAYTLSHRAPAALAAALINGPPIPVPYPLSFSAHVRRREDFLNLRFDFFNLKLDTTTPGKPRVVFANPAQGAAVAVVFAPQNIAEEAFFEAAPEFSDPSVDPLKTPGSVLALSARESRLAFQVPANTSIPFTIHDLLSWTGLTPFLVPVAPTTPPPPGQHIRAPLAYETSLELPWRLILSPNEKSAWAHALDPVTHGGRTELWHTRLAVRGAKGGVDESSSANRTVRAVWSRDPAFPGHLAKNDPETAVPDTPTPFRMSLTERDRYDIVRLTSDYTIGKYTPEAADVTRLMLSALGGFVDLRGTWNPPGPNAAGGGGLISLEEWRHKGTLARDHYVRIVRRGYLFPFGHRAVLIKVTERKFNPIPDAGANAPRGAYLRQRFFIIVREPDKDFGGLAPGQPNGGRRFPFTHVRITTLVTPSLQPPKSFDLSVGGDTDVFQPLLGPSLPFLFHMIGTDWVGSQAEFTTPVVFVNEDIAFQIFLMEKLASAYGGAPAGERTGDLQGRSVALAKSVKAGDTTVETRTMLWGGETPTVAPASSLDQPAFYPTMAEADVRLTAAEQVSGKSLSPTIEYFPAFVINDFHGGDVFAQLKGLATKSLQFGADKSGGVATPNFDIGGLSRQLGPVGDLAGIAAGTFDPSKYLGDAKLLGGLALKEIFKIIALATGSQEAMKLLQSTEPGKVIVNMHWEAKPPTLQAAPPIPPIENIFVPEEEAVFTLDVKVVTVLAHPDQSTFTVDGKLQHFTINLIDDGPAFFLALQFNQLHFTAQKGQKSNVTVDIANVTYGGVLAFVKELESIMSLGKQGPGIDLEPTGITAKFAVPIPTIAIGVFAISNLAFSAGVTIPFSGAPVRARFGFSERANPFQLQISMFAGGGFFALAVGADGVELLEAALEFGASVSLDIGVASGGVHIMAGIYFKFGHEPEKNVDTCVLTGFLRIGGELNVLDIISVSIELYMSFTYEKIGEKEKVIGQATLTLEVHVFVFSATISTSIERHFGNVPGDPSFAELMPPNTGDPNHSADWTEYCKAFAPI